MAEDNMQTKHKMKVFNKAKFSFVGSSRCKSVNYEKNKKKGKVLVKKMRKKCLCFENFIVTLQS